MTNVEILDNIELDIDDFFKKKHIKAYNIDSWTDKKSERTFNYLYEINKKVDSGALYDYLFSESDVLLHNLDMDVKIIYREITDYYIQVNIIISVPNELAESKESVRKSIKESADDNWYKLKMLNEMLDAMEEDEYNIPKLGIYGVTKNIDLDEGAIEALIKYYK